MTVTRLRWFDLHRVSAWVFTGCVVIFAVVGRAVDDASHGGIGRTALYAACFGIMSWIVSSALFGWFDRLAESGVEQEENGESVLNSRIRTSQYWLDRRIPETFGSSIKRQGWLWWLAILVCWLPWFIVCWPGVMRDDTIAQFMQSAGYHPYYSQHPIFDTLVFGLFWSIGSAAHNLLLGMGLYILVQALAFALGVALVLSYLRKTGAARSVQLIVFLFFALCPAIAGAVPTMSKDSLHAVFLLPLSIIFVECCLTRGRVLKRIPVCVSLVVLIMLCALSKRTATLAIICSFIVLLVLVKGYRRRVFVCLVLAVILAQGVAEPLMERATRAEVTPGKEVMGWVMLPVARVQSVAPELISSQEKQDFAGTMDLQRAGATYTDYRVDETSWTINVDATVPQKMASMRSWLALGFHAPGEYIKAYGNLMLGWFYPQEGVFYGWNSEGLFTKSYMRQWDGFVVPPLKAEDVLHSMRGTDQKPSVLLHAAYLGQRIASDPKLNAHAYYATYIPLLLLIYGISRKRWIAMAAGAMLGFNVLVLYLSPLVFSWYLLPVVFILPLFLGVTACDDTILHEK